ncbi:MAG: glycosyltransferase [Patescibacteria group bacterium]
MSSTKRRIKVLYLYSGSRKDKFFGKIGVDYPDTQFYGFNHLAKFGVEAETREFNDLVGNPLVNKLFGFRLRHLFLCFYARKYDIVFGSSILYTAILKRFICPKTKFILLNISTARTIESNRKKHLKLKFILWLLDEMDGVVCLSRSQIIFLKNIALQMADRLFYVPLGVDTVFYQPNYTGRKDYLLSVGRDNGRDYKTVIDTARLMPRQKFQIVCSKRNLAGIKDIPGNVEIIYDLPIRELKQKYLEAKALLLITHEDKWSEGADCSGQTVLLDAMASGLPIITSRKKYLEDYAVDNKEATFVDFYDPAKVKIAIESLNSVESRKEMTARARKRAEREFSTENMAKNLATVFNSLSGNENG